MRLGAQSSDVAKGTLAHSIYGDVVTERHRHRYEFNNKYREDFEKAGMTFSGVSPDNHLVEIVEITDKKFFVAAQYHPEFLSRPNRPEGLFKGFIGAASGLQVDKF